jgi:trehalose synthase
VLAGPDPESVADDPEGVEVLEELSARYTALDPHLQRDVVLLALPMDSQKQNALMVNALQRCASLVVQNSIREGFGLTVTEAMYKRLPVLASRAAGPRSQVEHGVHGWLIEDQLDPEGLADSIDHAMRDRIEAHSLAEAAQLRAHREFLVFRQAERWLEAMAASVERERIRVRAAH